jgi:hypothetical protein
MTPATLKIALAAVARSIEETDIDPLWKRHIRPSTSDAMIRDNLPPGLAGKAIRYRNRLAAWDELQAALRETAPPSRAAVSPPAEPLWRRRARRHCRAAAPAGDGS